MGAKGDGTTDDTAAFERAILRLGTAGGTVSVPRGVYRIDAVRSIRLASGMTLALAPGAVLAALPTGSGNYSIVRGQDVARITIRGGTIRGDRNIHLAPMTGEWGMGIDVRGCSGVSIHGVTVEACWGDGLYIGSTTPEGTPGGECENVRVRRCLFRQNRRQGVSITGCLGAVLDRCEFVDTAGTPPSAGVDLEPNSGKRVERVVVSNSVFLRNEGWGLQAGGAGVTGPTISGNRFDANGLGAMRLVRTRGGSVTGNRINVTRGMAVQLEETSTDNTVRANTVTQNGHPVRDGRLYVEKRGASGNRIERP